MEGDGRDKLRRMIFMCALFTAMYSVAAGLDLGVGCDEDNVISGFTTPSFPIRGL